MVERLTENCYPGVLHHPIGVFLHATRSGQDLTLLQEYDATVRYELLAGANSSHYVVGPDEATRLVRDGNGAWHAEENNYTHLSIEIAQPNGAVTFTEFQYQAVAKLCREWATKYDFPLRRVMSQTEPGIIGHEDSEQGKRWGKSDPGTQWDWVRLAELLV